MISESSFRCFVASANMILKYKKTLVFPHSGARLSSGPPNASVSTKAV